MNDQQPHEQQGHENPIPMTPTNGVSAAKRRPRELGGTPRLTGEILVDLVGSPEAMIQALADYDAGAAKEPDDPPKCPLCQDRGFWYPKLPMDDPAFGKVVRCPHKTDEWLANAEERLLDHWNKYTGIPKHHRGFRLETHPNLMGRDNPGLLHRLQTADFATASWFLWGDNSRGKTSMAVGYGWAYLQATGGRVMFRTVPNVLGELKATYGKSEETEANVLLGYKKAGLLILDDLGAEQIKETENPENTWVADRLYGILNHRLGEELPTVFTSNIGIRAVRDRVGRRISERVIEMCNGGNNIVAVKGNNLRWDE